MTITKQVQQIQQIIIDTAKFCHRDPKTIQLLAVSKGQSIQAIREVFSAGLVDFAESYLQEALPKMQSLSDLRINWHFIGSIQSKKVLDIAQNFCWVHSLSREKIARLLTKHRPENLPALNLCLQVNLDQEESKSGLIPQEVSELALLVKQLPRLRLRGLMAIPQPQAKEEEQYESLLRLTKLFKQLNERFNLSMDTLSMGMSHDLVAAIRAGSTILRIGRAIFGEPTR